MIAAWLAAEVKVICTTGREVYEGEVKKAILVHHERQLLEDVEKSKKMRQHSADNFKDVKEYLKGKSVENCCMAFRIRCDMVKEVKGNYMDKYRRRRIVKTLIATRCRPRHIAWCALTWTNSEQT